MASKAKNVRTALDDFKSDITALYAALPKAYAAYESAKTDDAKKKAGVHLASVRAAILTWQKQLGLLKSEVDSVRKYHDETLWEKSSLIMPEILGEVKRIRKESEKKAESGPVADPFDTDVTAVLS